MWYCKLTTYTIERIAMKSICIITSPETSDIAERIESILLYAGYEPFVVIKSYDNVYLSITEIRPEDCQLIISVDGFGFEKAAADGGSYFNRTPVNVLAILFNHAADYETFLKRRINYTVSFLVPGEEDVVFFRSNLKHIYHVDSYSSLEDLPAYLETFDWRF